MPACRSLDCVSIFARNLEDAGILLETTARFDPEDAYSRVLPERDPLPRHWKFGVPREEDLAFFGRESTGRRSGGRCGECRMRAAKKWRSISPRF